MNGRVEAPNPLLARFGTPDPMTENPFSTQGWNRYSYVGNPGLRRDRLPRQLQPSPQWRSLRYDKGLAVAKADTTDVDDIVKMLGSGASARELVGAALAFLVLYATLAAPRPLGWRASLGFDRCCVDFPGRSAGRLQRGRPPLLSATRPPHPAARGRRALFRLLNRCGAIVVVGPVGWPRFPLRWPA